jgi:sugar phosphate isomerase/epimerase
MDGSIMDFSCHIWAFDDLRLQEALGTIARMGFRYVDLGTGAHFSPARALDNDERKAMFREFQDNLARYNLRVADLYLFLPRISLDDEKKRKRDILLFKALLPFAKAFGASGVTVTSGLSHPDEDDDAWQRMVDALREMVSAAQTMDMPISVEPHLDSMVATIPRIERLMGAVDGLQLTLDWAQLVRQGIKHKAITALLPHTRHIQMRQATAKKLQVPFDKGNIKLEEVVAALQAAQYAGFVSVEYMRTEGWHGMELVNNVVECTRIRDALRHARDNP